jgi:hypothetical protein
MYPAQGREIGKMRPLALPPQEKNENFHNENES